MSRIYVNNQPSILQIGFDPDGNYATVHWYDPTCEPPLWTKCSGRPVYTEAYSHGHRRFDSLFALWTQCSLAPLDEEEFRQLLTKCVG